MLEMDCPVNLIPQEFVSAARLLLLSPVVVVEDKDSFIDHSLDEPQSLLFLQHDTDLDDGLLSVERETNNNNGYNNNNNSVEGNNFSVFLAFMRKLKFVFSTDEIIIVLDKLSWLLSDSKNINNHNNYNNYINYKTFVDCLYNLSELGFCWKDFPQSLKKQLVNTIKNHANNNNNNNYNNNSTSSMSSKNEDLVIITNKLGIALQKLGASTG